MAPVHGAAVGSDGEQEQQGGETGQEMAGDFGPVLRTIADILRAISLGEVKASGVDGLIEQLRQAKASVEAAAIQEGGDEAVGGVGEAVAGGGEAAVQEPPDQKVQPEKLTPPLPAFGGRRNEESEGSVASVQLAPVAGRDSAGEQDASLAVEDLEYPGVSLGK